jgi:CRP-like cAMP-binding protein
LVNPGKIFGDRILQVTNGKRTASVATTIDSSFLYIEKGRFLLMSAEYLKVGHN